MMDGVCEWPVYKSTKFTTGLLGSCRNPAAPFRVQFFSISEFRYRYFKPAKRSRTLAQDGGTESPCWPPRLPVSPWRQRQTAHQSNHGFHTNAPDPCYPRGLCSGPSHRDLSGWIRYHQPALFELLMKWRLFVSKECPTTAAKCRGIEMVKFPVPSTKYDCGFRVLRRNCSAA